MRKIIITALIAGITTIATAVTPLWMRYSSISPDGQHIAFAYQGDIYVVNSEGGQAMQLTSSNSYESLPIWSNDSKTIAFTSDKNGSSDIYVIPSTGGQSRRVTFNSASETPLSFSKDDKKIYFSASLQDPASSIYYPAGWITELYSINIEGGRPELISATPICSLDFDKDEKSYIYYNRTSVENIWRKHHVSSAARDIFYYDAKKGKHIQVTTNPGEDRDPLFTKDGKIVFLSERNGGSFNVYTSSLYDSENAVALTHFTNHPVRFLTQSDEGTLCFGYQGEIYTMKPGNKSNKVKIEIIKDKEEEIEQIRLNGVDELVASDDGKEIAVISRGEVFALTDKYSTTKQITHTAAAEKGLTITPDGKTIFYASERTETWNIYSATMGRKEDLHFAYSTIIKEEPLFKDNKVERTNPSISPDGKELAFIEDRKYLKVINLESGKVRTITDGSRHYQRDDIPFNYQWSPDGNWFAMEIITNQREPYSDIAIVSSKGTAEYHNVTNSGYIDYMPTWVMDGNALIYISNRHGMRSHGSWGSLTDVYIAFMNQETMDKFMMDEEEHAFFEESEESSSEEEEKEEDDDEEKNSDDDTEETKAEAVKIDFEKVGDRIVRLTPMSSDLISAVLSKDGEHLYFVTSFQDDTDLWSVNTRTGETSIFRSGVEGMLMANKDCSTMYVLGNNIFKISLPSGEQTMLNHNISMELDRAGEREYMFNHVFKQEKEKFYTTDYHGVDLKALKKAYEPFLSHINNNYDFSEMLSEILGELNVSHTGSGYRAPQKPQEITPEFGLLFDWNYKGDGLMVEEVIDFGPFDNFKTKVKSGVIIEEINGNKIKSGEDYYQLINGQAGKSMLLSLYDPSTKNRWEERTILFSKAEQNNLLYNRWVKRMEHLVDSLSGGRLGYVHLEAMDDDSYRTIYSDVLGKYNKKEGIVIDTRNNGGGRLHEDIEILFSGHKYLEQVVRGRVSCDMPSRRSNKPSIMLVCEANYSNAHGTPWVFQTMKLGKVVGMPVPGTMTSVNWEFLQDKSLFFGIPVIGYRTKEGYYLENHQLEPDVIVRNECEKAVNGEDQQIEAAVKTLLKQIDESPAEW